MVADDRRLLDCWIAGLLDCWIAGLLDCWIAGLLDCWIAGLLDCWIKLRFHEMNEEEFKSRTKAIAIEIARFATALPKNRVADVFGRQVIRSGSSVGANYRAACRARSDAEMVAKLGIAEEEADESQYWIELLVECGYANAKTAEPILKELDQIIAMIVASRRTLRSRIERQGNQSR